MHSVNLLVTDRSPESAEHINSLLRNSGIKIRVNHAGSSADVKRSLDADAPVLILFADVDEEEASLEEISELASAFDVPLALFADMESPDRLAHALSTTACFVINSAREDLLAEAVNRLVRNSENEKLYASRQQHLEELEHRYNLLLDSSRDAIAYIHEGLHVYANRAYLETIRVRDDDEILALSLLEMVQAEGLDLKTLLKGFSKGEFPTKPLEVQITRPDGSGFEANLVFSPARYNGEDCTQMMMQRKDAANELAAELERLRFIDPVTQLQNRRAFTETVDDLIAKGEHNAVASVLYMEIDGFNALQNELSAKMTDEFLSDFAEIIRAQIGPEDSAARLGEAGFAILAQRESVAGIEQLAQGILKTYRAHAVDVGERTLSASCSIGMANIGRLSSDSSEVIAHARSACSEAAQQGDGFAAYRPQLTAVESKDDDQSWTDRIKFALSNHDFYTVQQSIVDLDGEGDQLMENIAFLHAEDGDLPPADYLEQAERSDLAGTIDRHVIPVLLKAFVDRDERQVINLSSNSILDYSFPGWFAEQMTDACVEGDKVILQIAASAAHTNLRPAQRLMKELKPMGCQLSVCQFDADRRTLQLLEHIDASYIKLHTSLTHELISNTKNQEAIRKIVEVAEPLGIEVIADEVADTSSLAVLWQCGVKLIAGAFLNDSSQVLAQ